MQAAISKSGDERPFLESKPSVRRAAAEWATSLHLDQGEGEQADTMPEGRVGQLPRQVTYDFCELMPPPTLLFFEDPALAGRSPAPSLFL